MEPENSENRTALWPGDSGSLHQNSRRALLALLRGPYLSGRRQPDLWAALSADEAPIRSRLHDLFLDLVMDRVDEFAFTRKVRTTEIEVPSALNSVRLSFIDTAMLLVLRQILLVSPDQERVIVGQEEVFDHLAIYRDGDEATFGRNLNAAWARMKNRLRVIHDLGDDRAEISPMVRFLIDEDRVRTLTDIYRGMSGGGDGGNETVHDDGGEADVVGNGDGVGEGEGTDRAEDDDAAAPEREPSP